MTEEQVWVQGTSEGVEMEGWMKVTYPDSAPTPEPPAGWEFKGLFSRDEDFTAAYAKLGTMGLNSMQVGAYKGSGNSQIVNRLNQITGAGHTGWIYFGSGFTADVNGGSFGISDDKLRSLMANVAGHAKNSHRYQVCDEINLTNFLTNADALKKNLDTIKARVELIRSLDSKAIISTTDYREDQLDPNGPAGKNIWVGVFDEVKLDGYANWEPYDETFIPNQAKWCEGKIPYCAVMSCHQYQTNKPKYPTTERFDYGTDQWKSTKARDFYLYTWNDGEGDKSLHQDPDMQSHIGEKMATV